MLQKWGGKSENCHLWGQGPTEPITGVKWFWWRGVKYSVSLFGGTFCLECLQHHSKVTGVRRRNGRLHIPLYPRVRELGALVTWKAGRRGTSTGRNCGTVLQTAVVRTLQCSLCAGHRGWHLVVQLLSWLPLCSSFSRWKSVIKWVWWRTTLQPDGHRHMCGRFFKSRENIPLPLRQTTISTVR